MPHLRLALPLALSLTLIACGVEESSTPAPGGGSEAGTPAPGDQGSTGAIVEELGEQAKKVGGQVEEAAKAATAKADTLIEKITTYLGENKLDLAKTAFAQLEALKDQLPASYQAQIEKVRSLIETNGLADKANNLIDSLGGSDKD